MVACFHTLWSAGSVKVMPAITELVPQYQDMASFISVRADGQGVISISKRYDVREFPTFIIFRGGVELERLVGSERVVENLVRCLGVCLTPDDKMAHSKHRHRLRMERALLLGEEPPVEEVEERGQLDWTWDPEQCGSSIIIQNDGMEAVFRGEMNDDDQAVWEWSHNGQTGWKPVAENDKIEKSYKSGDLYRREYINTSELEFELNCVNIASYEVSGFCGTMHKTGRYIYVRRRGERCPVPGEDRFLTKEQKERDKRNLEWKEKYETYKKKLRESRIGNDIEAIRGTIGMLPNTGIHYWILQWNHEPGRLGTCDAVGICSDACESFSAGPTPKLGGSADSGASVALYASGEVFHNGKLLTVIKRDRIIKTLQEPTIENKGNNEDKEKEKKADKKEKGDKKKKKETTDKKKQRKIRRPPPTIPAPLFGWQSCVRCELNTDVDGGTLSFSIDGTPLEYVLFGVYSLLGGSEIFPCLSMCPLDLIDVSVDAEKKEKKKSESEKKKENENAETEENSDNGSENDNDKDADDQKQKEGDAEDAEPFYPSVRLFLGDEYVMSYEGTPEAQKVEEQKEGVEATAEGTAVSTETEPTMAEEKTDEKAKLETDGEAKAENGETTTDKKDGEAEKVPEEAKTIEVPIDKVRWMYETKRSWECYSVEVSKELEESLRDGKTEYTIYLGDVTHTCNLESKKLKTDEDDDDNNNGNLRLRRHIMSDGLQGLWEMLAFRYERPHGLSGEGLLKILNKAMSGLETINGAQHGLGFLFLYSLLSGEVRCKVNTGDYGSSSGGTSYGPSNYSSSSSGYGRKSSSGGSSDSHRFGVLLTQLFKDKHTKSLPASVLHVLGRNRQVSLRMPKFKDTRKVTNTPIFAGWVDETEPRSPVAELFSKLVPLMGAMKKKGAFHFPPLPPYEELPSPASSVTIPVTSFEVEKVLTQERPELSDYGCDTRALSAMDVSVIAKLASTIQYRLGADLLRPQPPLHVEDTPHFERIIAENPDRLYIIDFHATWCGPCRALVPVYRYLAMQTPTALFLKV